MVFQIYIKTFYFIVAYIFLLTSCGLIGGDDKVDASENSVLSGPPLAIPPEFDIDSQGSNQQQSMSTYDFETLDEGDNLSNFEDETAIAYESTENENIFTDEISDMTNIENTGEIQSFESFNPNLTRTIRQTNINVNPKAQKTYGATVPSDSYIQNISPKFGRINQKTYVQKKKDNFVGFGTQSFEKIGTTNTGDLSKEEEFLLEDILNTDNTR